MVDPLDSKHVSPELQATYKNQFARGVKLFEESLTEHEKTDRWEKKAKFEEVMDKALNIMNESAQGFLSAKGQKDRATLESDYHTFLAKKDDVSLQKLNSDIEKIKRYT